MWIYVYIYVYIYVHIEYYPGYHNDTTLMLLLKSTATRLIRWSMNIWVLLIAGLPRRRRLLFSFSVRIWSKGAPHGRWNGRIAIKIMVINNNNLINHNKCGAVSFLLVTVTLIIIVFPSCDRHSYHHRHNIIFWRGSSSSSCCCCCYCSRWCLFFYIHFFSCEYVPLLLFQTQIRCKHHRISLLSHGTWEIYNSNRSSRRRRMRRRRTKCNFDLIVRYDFCLSRASSLPSSPSHHHQIIITNIPYQEGV